MVLQRGKMVDIGPIKEVMSSERLSRTLETEVNMQYMQDGRMDLRVN
jgi:ABC-type enterochelin transport system ATPase subunit